MNNNPAALPSNTPGHVVMGTEASGDTLTSAVRDFCTHACVLGMTGSGKTGVTLGMAEELARNKVPIVLLDIKGDMANIFLQDGALGDQINPRLLTPGADHGERVNVVSSLTNPGRVREAVTSLLDLISVPSDPLKSRHVFLSRILKTRHKKGQRCELLDIVTAIQHPPFSKIGAMDLDDVISPSLRKALAGSLNNVLVADTFEHWREGIALDIGELTKETDDGRTPVVVYSIAHLTSDRERAFAISLLVQAMVSFMRKSRGTEDLRLSFIIDECAGLMPPTGGGPIKEGLLTLLQQGRSTGIGLILATQNPMQIDYKAMGQCGTWVIGRLMTDNDRKRMVQRVCGSVPGISKKELTADIGSLRPRHFLMARAETLTPFLSRTTSCNLVGPMTPSDLVELNLTEFEPVELVEEEGQGVFGRVFSMFSKAS